MMQFMATAGSHISVKADEIANIGGVSITNSSLLGLFGLLVLVWLMFSVRAVAVGKKKKHNLATGLIHWAFDGLYDTVRQVIPDEKWAKKVATQIGRASCRERV